MSVKTLTGQSYCFQFEERVMGSRLEVDIVLTASSDFRLGNSNFKFTYNIAALSLQNPIPYVTALPVTYSTSAQSVASGVISMGITYNGVVNSGRRITASGVKLGTVIFEITNPVLTRDFTLINNGVQGLNILKDDNTTLLVPSVECSPSPYASLFYDARIELDATIPMNECVEPNTPNSQKINFGDDETREILPAGFKFKFYCEDVTSLKIGADGALLVNSATGATVPSTNSGKLRSLPKVIAPWWDEWRKGMGSINCLLKDTVINGTSTRMFILQWNGLSPVDNVTGSNLDTDPLKATFNVVIIENSSVIKFNYKDIDFINDTLGHPELYPIVERKQNGVDGSVGMKSLCTTGSARDGVNNIVFDGPIGVSLFDVNSARVYKSITFLPVSGACEVPLAPIDTSVCQGSTPIKLPFRSSAINGTWTGTGTTYLNNKNIQNATFNPTTAGQYALTWEPGCPNFAYTVNIKVIEKPTGRLVTPAVIRQCSNPNFVVRAFAPGVGVGKWETINGVGVFNSTDTSATITGVPEGGFATVRWVVSSGTGCNDTINVALYNITKPVAAVEKPLIEQCNNPNFTAKGIFAATATGTWSIFKGQGSIVGSTTSTTVTVNGVPADSTTILRLTVSDGTCSTIVYDTLKNYKSVKGVVLTPNPMRQCGNANFTVIASKPSGAVGKWEFVNGQGVFTPLDTTATINGVPEGTNSTIRWVVNNGVCSDTTKVELYNVTKPVAAVEKPLIEQCENPNFTVKGIFSTTATGTWSIVKGPGTIVGSIAQPIITVNGVLPDSTTVLKLEVFDGTCNTILFDTLKNYKSVKGVVLTPNPMKQCANANFTVIASKPSGAVGRWEFVSGQGVFTPFDTTATINGIPEGSNSTIRWIVNNGVCSDTTKVELYNVSKPLAAVLQPLIEQCNTPNFTAVGVFGATATGTWSIIKGPGTIVGSNTQTTVNVNGVLPDSTTILKLEVSDGLCSTIVFDTLKNYKPVTASLVTVSPLRQCNNPNFTIEATTPSVGIGTWIKVGGVGTVGEGNPTTVTGVPAGFTTSMRWKVVNGACKDSVNLSLMNDLQPKATLVSKPLIEQCGNSTFTVQGGSIPASFASAGTWKIISGVGTVGTGNPATVTGITSGTTTIALWTVVNGACRDSIRDTLVHATFSIPKLVTPTNMEQCDNSTFNVEAVAPSVGTGTWTLESGVGTINGTTHAITVTGVTVGTTTVLKWKVINDNCTDSVRVTLKNVAPIKANLAVPTLIEQCNKDLFTVEGVLPTVGTGTWTIVKGPGTISGTNPAVVSGVSPDSTTIVQWKVVNGPCADSVRVTLRNFKFVAAQLQSAPPFAQCNNPTFVLTAVTPSSGTGVWSKISGGGVLSGTNPITVTDVLAGTNTTLKWKVTNGVCQDSTVVTITNDVLPSAADAGPDQTKCAIDSFKMAAFAPSVGTGTWTILGGSSTTVIVEPNNPTTMIKGVPLGSSVVLRWTIKNGTCITTDDVKLTNSTIPVANAGADQALCPGLPFSLTGSAIPAGGKGTWRIIGDINGAVISDPQSAVTTITNINPSSSILVEWKLENEFGCSSTDTVKLTVYEALYPNAGADQVSCNDKFTLAATNPEGKWTVVSSANAITISDDTKPNTQVSNVAPGSVVILKWTISNTNCSASDTVKLYYDNAAPVPIAKRDTTYCNTDTNLTCYGRYNDTLRAVDANNNGTLFYSWSISRNPSYGAPPITSGNSPYIYLLLNVGDYLVSWTVRDACGNTAAYQSYKLKIKDCVPPTIVNFDKRVTLGGSPDLGGESQICATHILKSISDNCTDSAYLMRGLRIIRDSDNPSRTYSPNFPTCIKVTCADKNDTIKVQSWTVDEAGTPGYVISTILVTDNTFVCPADPLTNISLSTKNDANIPIKNVNITALEGSKNTNLDFGFTGVNGLLVGKKLNIGGAYTFKADKTDEPYLGVTTFDIAAISKHILDIEPLKSPYLLLAADVNEDGSVDSRDMLIIRNFILKKTPTLPRRTWRFVDSSYVIQNRTNPFEEDIPELISINQLPENSWRAFKAIKKGDVIGLTVNSALVANTQERQSQRFVVSTDDRVLEQGKDYIIPITVKGFNASSYQFTLSFTEGGATVKTIETGNLPNMADGNFALFKNSITTSWNGSSYNMDNATLLNVHIKAQRTAALSELLTLNSSLTAVEAIDNNNQPLSVELEFNNSIVSKTDFALYQNTPNPFDSETKIAFKLPKETTAQLTIYALDGRILYTQKGHFSVGQHEIKIDKNNLNGSGVMYYRLDTPDFTATRKMILIK